MHIVTSDYIHGGQVTFTSGGPNEVTAQLKVWRDQILEFNKTYMLRLQLSSVSAAAGVQLGPNNVTQVTVIDDDCETKCFNMMTELMLPYRCASVLSE